MVPFAPTGIDHVVFRVRDVPTMLAFYQDVLGCTLEHHQEALGLYHLRAGRSLIDLIDIAGKLGRSGGAAPGKEGRNVEHVCLGVAPFDEAALRAHLARHKVEILEAGPRFGADGEGPAIYIRDPEGNTIELKGADD